MTAAEDALVRCPLFAELPDDDLLALARIAIPRRHSAGTELFMSGDEPEGLHVVTRGRIRIYVLSPESGRALVLTSEHPYHAVAELPSFDGGTYPANAQAEEDSETLLLPQGELDALLERRATLSRHLLRTLGRRLRRLVTLVEQLSFQEVIQRLARHLLARGAEGLPFELETNGDIAASLGTVPELVSRNLSRLQQQGMVTLERRTVVALDAHALRDLAGSARR